MKARTSFTLKLAGALLIVIASAAIAAAQTGTDTCAGLNATIGGTCTPLTNTISGSNDNTTYGAGALQSNTSGIDNTATGQDALFSNTTGSDNTATGQNALTLNTMGSDNTATGVNALQDNSSGGNNTATGENALQVNDAGSDNTAIGVGALQINRSGGNNTATGENALENNLGDSNTATGTGALGQNTTGNNNIAIGYEAGSNIEGGDNDIDIGNAGATDESNTIRIGKQGTQTETHIAGIFNSPGTKKACQVVVQSNGKLDCMASSARYKHDIHDMGTASDKLMKLRPVTFQYKEDSSGIRQYGLIAEEVEKVYPELVIDGSDGRAQTVAYQELPALLLNEVQKEHRDSERKTAQIAKLTTQNTKLNVQVAELKASMRRQNVSFDQRLSRIERTVALKDGGRNIVAAFRQ